jgi:hypothetical protein
MRTVLITDVTQYTGPGAVKVMGIAFLCCRGAADNQYQIYILIIQPEIRV